MIERLGVVGAGVMGLGIAQTAAQHGLSVLLVSRDESGVRNTRQRIAEGIRRSEELGKIAPGEGVRMIERIACDHHLDRLREVEAVIEAVPENAELKLGTLARLDHAMRPDGLLLTNTSTFPITMLAAATRRPARLLGMHFFNPAPAIPGVELVAGRMTSEETVARGRALVERLGKVPVMAKDFAGFITTRLIIHYLNEAARSVMDGNAPQDVDAAMVHCMRMPMGPCALMDLIGIDIVLSCLETLHGEFGSRFEPAPLLREMARSGRLGRKTGRGFHEYPAKPARDPARAGA